MGYSLVELMLAECYWCRRNGGGEWELEFVERSTDRLTRWAGLNDKMSDI